MAESLRTNPTLTSLNLESNSISSVGRYRGDIGGYPYRYP